MIYPVSKLFIARTLPLLLVAITACRNLQSAEAESPLRGTPIPSISLKDVHAGTAEIDLNVLNSYGPVPDSVQQFYIDSRKVFDHPEKQVSFDHPAILQAATDHGRWLLGGPMLGDLKAGGVTLWLRPATGQRLTVSLEGPDGPLPGIAADNPVAGEVVRVQLDHLEPQTAYTYTVHAAGNAVAAGTFTTAPLDDTPGHYRIAFGADFHKIGLHNPTLFQSILKREPSVMLLAGDSAADDRRENMNLHRADYLLRDSSPSWSEFSARVPTYAIWDDHDYFDDDLSGLQDGLFTEADRDALRAVWFDNWNNPPVPAEQQGIYFKTRLGPVEVFMLDTRSCRDHGIKGDYGSFLGKKQQQWLLDGLRDSTAPFKILAGGTMWSDYVSKGKDSWATWDTEALEEIFTLIENEKIGGVLLISGDRHGARGFRIPRDSGFEFIELEVGSLGGIHGPPGRVENCPEQLFGHDGEGFTAFGELDFDTTGEPSVTFRLIGESGDVLEKHRFTLKELTP